MAVSDAQFLRYLRRGNAGQGVPLVVLAEIEFAYETVSGPATGTIYLADGKYRTRPTDSPANVRYRDVIESGPTFERAIDLKKLGGRGTMSAGSLTLNNADGSLDFLRDVIIDGREVRFYVGAEGWARSDFRLVNVAVVAAVSAPNDLQLVLELRSKSYLLDDTIIGNPITGGLNAGKPKPILLGYVKNFDITPYLQSGATLAYWFSNFSLDPAVIPRGCIEDVRDAGVSLYDAPLFIMQPGTSTANTATDTITHSSPHGLAVDDVVYMTSTGSTFAGLSLLTQYWVIAAGLTANDFRLSLTRGGAAVDITGAALPNTTSVFRQRFYSFATGEIQLVSEPAGRVTMDVLIYDAGGTMDSPLVPHKMFKFILQHHVSLDAEDIDYVAIDALIAEQESALLSYGGLAILDRMNVLDILDEIAVGTMTWFGWNAEGVLTVGSLDLANLDAATSIDTINKHDILGDLSWENLPLPWGKLTIDTDRNVVVQTDGLASSVSAENRSLWGRRFQERVSTTDPGGTTYLANWWDYHAAAIDSKPIELNAIVGRPLISGDIQELCDAMTAQFRPWTRAFRCTVGLDKYALNPGDCVTLTYPRYGLDAGVKVRVVSVRTRVSDQRVDLVLVRQVTPDYTSTSHP